MIELQNIKKEIDFLFKGIPRSTTLPILKSVAIEEWNGEATMRTTDLADMSYVKFPSTHKGLNVNGAVTITKRLVRKENVVTAKKLNGKPQVYWNDVPVITTDIEAYPVWIKLKGKIHKLPFVELWPMLEKAVKYTSNDEMKPCQMGVHVRRKGRKTVVEATNGYRIFMDTKLIKDMPDIELLIPASSIKRIKGLLKLSDDVSCRVALGPKKDKAYMETKNGQAGMVSQLLVERYPDVDSAIHDKYEYTCRGNTKTWLETLRYIADVGHIHPATKQVVLHKKKCYTHNPDTGLSHTFEIPVNAPLEIAFNIRYLLDIFRSVSTETFTWKFTDARSVSCVQPSGEAERYYLMPMNPST